MAHLSWGSVVDQHVDLFMGKKEQAIRKGSIGPMEQS
jgi:hypothetical protein